MAPPPSNDLKEIMIKFRILLLLLVVLTACNQSNSQLDQYLQGYWVREAPLYGMAFQMRFYQPQQFTVSWGNMAGFYSGIYSTEGGTVYFTVTGWGPQIQG